MGRRIFLVLVCVVVTGCSSTATKGIRGSDHAVVIPDVELGMTIVGDDVTDEQPEELGSRIALQASFSSLKSKFDQLLTAGEYVDYDTSAPYTGNSRYDGPINLTHKADLGIGYLNGMLYWAVSKEFALSYQLGLANIQMKLDTAGGGLSSSFDDDGTSLYGGIGVHYHYNSSIDIEGMHRAVLPKHFPFYFFTADDFYSIASDSTIRLVVKQNKWLKYFAGYRVINYAYTCLTCDDDPSTIHINFSGISAGVGLNF